MDVTKLPDGRIRFGPIADFDPVHTFLCGQCFRWTRLAGNATGFPAKQDAFDEIPTMKADAAAGSVPGIGIDWQGLAGNRAIGSVWQGLVGNRAIRLHWDGSFLNAEGTTEREVREFWLGYLDLDRDYPAMKRILSEGDPIMAEAIRFGWGLRLLRQDPWETLVTFLISQNNGIPRIRRIVDTLCACFGEPVVLGDEIHQAFPTPEALADLDSCDLDVCRAGYRSAYVLRTAAQVTESRLDLHGLADLPYGEARNQLLALHGVGVKVADCALLFSGLHRSAFPVDRWVLRVMAALYPGSRKTTEDLQSFAAQKWGPLAGLAQEYLFYYARENQIRE